MQQTLSQLEHARVILIAYMKMKMSQADWHGVSDAANDLRELEVLLEREKVKPCHSN
jgi:hypothetical protein